ncbi:MAG: hypothetical protein KDE63_11640 [Novosphingobium sp.]|nr:hypothetical protein [Novosphingobium sp.]
MRIKAAFSVLVFTLAAMPVTAMADDPNDPEMQTRAAREADRAKIRQMNKDMLAQVTARDAEYARANRESQRKTTEYQRRLSAYHNEQSRYASDRKRYEQTMADWRRNVAACNAGNYSACR